MKVRWHTMGGTNHSWSYTAQALARAMKNIGGHEIYFKSTNNLEFFPEDLKDILLPGYHGHLVQGEANYLDGQGNDKIVLPKNPEPELPDTNRPYDLELAYTIPYQYPRRFYSESRCRAAIWNFESSILPPGWQMYTRAIDYILPSSQFSYDIFANNGIPEEKMVLVPHGVDTNIFNPEIPPFQLKTRKRIKFLHNAIPHHRKLHERVIKGFIDTFTGNDDVCLVLKTKFVQESKEKPFEVDVKKIIEEALNGKRNPPEIEIINTFIPNMGSLYTACDVVVSMSATEGFCFLPETQVDTDLGPIPINMVEIGDKVIGINNKLNTVYNKTHRFVNEELVGIRRLGESNVIYSTKEHPILCLKRNGKTLCQLNKELKTNEANISWQCAKNISCKDFVVLPKPKYKSFNNVIKIDDFVDCETQSGSIMLNSTYSSGITYREIAGMCNSSRYTVSKVLNENKRLKNGNHASITKTARRLKWFKPTKKMINGEIIITPEIAEFFGLYIAEGFSYKNIIGFSSHRDETYARDLEKRVLEKDFNQSVMEFLVKSSGKVTAACSVLARLFRTLFGENSKSKKIPEFLFGSSFINYVLRGIFYGDGTVSGNRYEITTSSEKLASGIFQILLSKNILSYIYRYTHKDGRSFIKISIAKHHEYRFEELVNPKKYNNVCKISKGHCKNIRSLENDDYFFVPVLNIIEKSYKGPVHNLEVKEAESYTCNGMIVHNCLPLLEALACDKLIIAPRHSGQLDFLNDNNSLLVNTGEMLATQTMQYWGYMEGAVVGDPSIEHYKELLSHVYQNLDVEKARVKDVARKTVELFSWERAAQMILDLPIPEKSMRIPEKKKVLYIIPYKMVGGAEVWVRQAIRQLDRTVYEPHVALISGTEENFKQSLLDLGVTVEDLSGPVGRDRALKCLIEAENYSIIHFYNSFGVYRILQEAWGQGFRCRTIETVHSELNWNDSMVKVATRGEHVTAIAAVSNQMGRKLLKTGNKNVVVLPQQIDWERFDVPRSKEILNELNIYGDFIVGFVGRLSPEKNIPIILHCAKMLPNIAFVIVGDGPQRQPLEQMANGLKNVYFVGPRSDVEKFYAAFDLLILPSSMEGMPLVILEAMAAGTPIIASDVGSILEVVFDGITGSLVWNPGNPNLFVKEIQRFRSNRQLWERCSINCKAVANASKEKVASFNINHLYNLLFQNQENK